MPIIKSNYRPSTLFRNGFYSTVYSGIIRKVDFSKIDSKRERLTLSDGDFIDLDWDFSNKKSDKLLLMLHGLEGDSKRAYMLGSSKLFNSKNFTIGRMNFRGCSGEENALFRSYHSGATSDLAEVIQHILAQKQFKEIYLLGFSLGANVILKYLGESDVLPVEIKAAVAVSVPCYLEGSANSLVSLKNLPYAIRFKRNLIKTLRAKQKKFPEQITKSDIKKIKTLIDFDDVYTSKAHGFENARDYYSRSSSLQFLPSINIPTLILNAKNDSFLSEECYPIKEAKENPNLFLEIPEYGGHVGFHLNGEYYYNEIRALEFIENHST
ncbi:hypothetical protein SAMN03097699_1266 [Flavobacteriaceae bacterium MAR_2010_188]|nr:hypothetical protein SAMN03097699_1266 [Flavobacteriaceae bacterium MAR_2010_188]